MVDVKTWMDLVRSLIRLTQIRFVGTLDICLFPIIFVLVFPVFIIVKIQF